MLLAIALTVAVIMLANLLFPPPPRPDAPEVPEVPVAEDVPEVVPAPVRPPPPPAEVAPEAAPEVELAVEETIAVRSPLYRYGYSTRGGGLVRAELLRFESFANPGAVVDLVPEDALALLAYRLQVRDRALGQERVVNLRRAMARMEPAEGLTLAAGEAPRAWLQELRDPETGIVVTLEQWFDPAGYVSEVRGRVEGLDPQVLDRPVLLLDIGPRLAVHETDSRDDKRTAAYVVHSRRDGIRSVRLESLKSDRIEEGPLVWVGLKNKYFLLAALSLAEEAAGDFGGLIARPAELGDGVALTVTLPVRRDGTFEFELYMGPQEFDRLSAVGRRLEDVNPYGFRIFRPVIQPLAYWATWALVQMQRFLGVGYGWVLILFGILLRVLLWPLHARAMRAQLKNMAVQPLLKEIQEKYKKDPERLQKEMVRLYKEEGFNPLGGCLPMLIPFPILITLFFVFQGTIEFRGVEFLWLPDLSRPDPYYLLPLVLGGSMWLIQWLSARVTPNPTPQMKMLLWFMPIFMVVIFANLASGLNLYYAASNLATIPQQLQLMRERQRMQAKAPPAKAAKPAK